MLMLHAILRILISLHEINVCVWGGEGREGRGGGMGLALRQQKKHLEDAWEPQWRSQCPDRRPCLNRPAR